MRGPVHPCRRKMRPLDWLSAVLIALAVGSSAVPVVLPEILRVVRAVPAAQPECPSQQAAPQQLKVFDL